MKKLLTTAIVNQAEPRGIRFKVLAIIFDNIFEQTWWHYNRCKGDSCHYFDRDIAVLGSVRRAKDNDPVVQNGEHGEGKTFKS